MAVGKSDDKIIFVADLSLAVRSAALDIARAKAPQLAAWDFESIDVIHATIVMAGLNNPETVSVARQVAGLVRLPPIDVALATLMVFAGPKRILGLNCASAPSGWKALRDQLGDVPRRLTHRRTPKVGGQSPHLSLAYGAPADFAVVRLLEPLSFRIDAFKLIHSVHGQGRHVELGRWSLV